MPLPQQYANRLQKEMPARFLATGLMVGVHLLRMLQDCGVIGRKQSCRDFIGSLLCAGIGYT